MKKISLSNEKIEYCGRVDTSNTEQPIFIFPSSFMKFHCSGNNVSFVIENYSIVGDGYFNFVGVIADGVQYKYLLNETGITNIKLELNPIFKEHEIMLFKRMNAHEFKIKDVFIDDDASIISFPIHYDFNLEVYGDSVSVGEVSEAVKFTGQYDPVHKGEYSNSYYSYSWMCARKLNARFHNISQSGIALLNNTGYFNAPNYVGMENVYDKLHYDKNIHEIENWDFTKYTADVVIIAIGQNDTYPNNIFLDENLSDKLAHWIDTYILFVKSLLDKYQNALIILTTTIMEHVSKIDETLDDICKQMNDKRVLRFRYSKNGIGTKGHIRISEADAMADELAYFVTYHRKQLKNC